MADHLTGLLELPADVSGERVSEHAAAYVRNGGGLDQANAMRAAHGMGPIDPNSAELAEVEFRREASQPNPNLNRLFELEYKMQTGTGKLTDRGPSPSDFPFFIRPDVELPLPEVDFHNNVTQLLSGLGMTKEGGKAVFDGLLNALQRESSMSPFENEQWGQQQLNDLVAVLGDNAEQRLKTASATLKTMSGRDLDLLKIVRSNGATTAATLLFQAETWAATKGRSR